MINKVLASIDEFDKNLKKMESDIHYKLGKKAELEREIRVGREAYDELMRLEKSLEETMYRYMVGKNTRVL